MSIIMKILAALISFIIAVSGLVAPASRTEQPTQAETKNDETEYAPSDSSTDYKKVIESTKLALDKKQIEPLLV